jgi:Ca-activated chloride channel homolog
MVYPKSPGAAIVSDAYIIQHPVLLAVLGIIVCGAAYYRWFLWRPWYYQYPLTSFLKNNGACVASWPRFVLLLLRSLLLLLLVLLICRVQKINSSSPVHAQGINIMMVLDVSGSMQFFDDLQDPVTRIDVAKREAVRFIDRRVDDQFGLILVGRQAVSRCPLTLDKTILKQIINDISIGVLDAEATMLGFGMLMGVNRLKGSKAASNIMIVLTDGQPSPGDVPPAEVISIAKKLGIKIYTIGIGGEEGGYGNHPWYGLVQLATPLNIQLLTQLAEDTGGKFFRASRPQDMREIYEKIDALEKSDHETTIFHSVTDIVKPIGLLAFFIALLEWIITTTWWFIV